jgi:hypothetical protein
MRRSPDHTLPARAQVKPRASAKKSRAPTCRKRVWSEPVRLFEPNLGVNCCIGFEEIILEAQ